MPNLASWIRRRDERWFNPILSTRAEITVLNAARSPMSLQEMDALLLTGGKDIAAEYLRQPVPDPTILEKPDPARDEWEFAAVGVALERGLPILAICKGMQLLNVALGGTLRLDIPGHNLPRQKSHDVSRFEMTTQPRIVLRRLIAPIIRQSIGSPRVASSSHGARLTTSSSSCG